jgi:hypothetical protein
VTDKIEEDEILDDDAINYSISQSKDKDDPPVEIDDEPTLLVVQEQEPKEQVVTSSIVEDTVECNAAATKLQSIQRGRVAQKKVTLLKKDTKKKRYDEYMAKQEEKEHDIIATEVKQNVNSNMKKDEAVIKLQSLQRQRSSTQKVEKMKTDKLSLEEQTKHDVNNSNPSQSAESPKTIEITEITPTPTPPTHSKPPSNVTEKSKQYIGYKEGVVSKPKPIISKKVPRNNPKKAIAEAAQFLANKDKQPIVPETKSDELKLPQVVNSDSNIEPTNRRKNRGSDLKHVNKRTMASLEKLETVAKETAPLESKSAPPNGRLPKIG